MFLFFDNFDHFMGICRNFFDFYIIKSALYHNFQNLYCLGRISRGIWGIIGGSGFNILGHLFRGDLNGPQNFFTILTRYIGFDYPKRLNTAIFRNYIARGGKNLGKQGVSSVGKLIHTPFRTVHFGGSGLFQFLTFSMLFSNFLKFTSHFVDIPN